MTAPTPEELAEWTREHHPLRDDDFAEKWGNTCFTCGEEWPCPTYRLINSLAEAKVEGARQILVALEAQMLVEPREFDAKTRYPELAHERCKQPNCSLRPWGLGTVTPDEPRYCPAHQTLNEAIDAACEVLTRIEGCA